MAKLMNAFGKNKINPLIGSAGVSAVPMAARVSNKVGLETDPHNFLLMFAQKHGCLLPLIKYRQSHTSLHSPLHWRWGVIDGVLEG
jgi:hypothetical protein